jgi:asparagine synthase (glutamine-hydrolysing)
MSVDGSVFDNGGNAAARHTLQANRTITSSGGGGEIFRNFFHLPDRALRLRDLVHAFYRQFDPSTATRRFDEHCYDAAIEQKMSAALDGANGVVDRQLIEQLYPAFRCRANFGREISIVGRYGAYFVPFLESAVVRAALNIPVREKKNGQFEARLIRRLDPRLARYRTVYGRELSIPRWTSRIDEAATVMRPTWLRRNSYRMKTRMRPQRDGHGGLLDSARLKRVIDIEFPALRAYFMPERFRDDGLLRRVALVEYMVQRLGSKVSLD